MTTVYYTCSFVPPELIKACGCTPVRLVPSKPNTPFSNAEGMCSYARSWLQALSELYREENPVVIFTTGCDQMRRAYDFYRRECNNDCFLLDVPSMDTMDSFEYYCDELKRLQNFLCRCSQNQFDRDILSELMLNHFPVTQWPDNDNSPKIAFTGGPLSQSIRNDVNDIINGYNGCVYFDATEDQLSRSCIKFNPESIQQDTLSELTRAYFMLPAIWKRPNTSFIDYFCNQSRQRSIDGVIIFRHVFCDMWSSQLFEFKRRLSVPVIDINLEDSACLAESAVSRIHSFMEILR